jgi:hypothetical protein
MSRVAEVAYTRPLREERVWDDGKHPSSISGSSEEGSVGGSLRDLLIEPDTFGDFVHLKINERVGFIAVTVPFQQNRSGLFDSPMRDQPSWRFRDQPEDKD